MKKSLIIIAAADVNGGIGRNGTIPWDEPSDRAFFATTTKTAALDKQNAVIMGRNTYQSLPKKLPLPNRINVVISSQLITGADFVTSDFNAAIAWCCQNDQIDKIFICGGTNIYKAAIMHPLCTYAHITKLDMGFNCDVKFPFAELREQFVMQDVIPLRNDYSRVVANVVNYKRSTDEYAYLDLLRNVMINGKVKPNRTETAAVSLFSQNLQFKLTDVNQRMIMPLLTTKQLPYRVIIEELIWFLRGGTNTDYLHEKNVKIWDGNSSRTYLDSRGLKYYREGELGPIYGAQWRHFGGDYVIEALRGQIKDAHSGVDQISNLIEGLKTDPFGRRHVVTAWNPTQLNEQALPPCHLMFIFNVDADKSLNCQVIMRSADLFLGVPFNIASYATLTHIIANIVGLTAGTLAINMVDCHIYNNHISQVNEQLTRQPRLFPYIEFTNFIDCIDDVKYENIKLNEYYPYKAINAEMII